MTTDKNCLSYWFPKLVAAGVPVPRTTIIDAGPQWHALADALEGKLPPIFTGLVADVTAAARAIGFPCFLRTGQGSGKHQWGNTCHVPDAASIPDHIANLIEWSSLVSIMGLPFRVWCVREMLPVEPIATLPRYHGMPLVAELRAFIRDGKAACVHNYWPVGAIAQGLDCQHGMPRVGFMEDEPESCSQCDAEAHRLFTAADASNQPDAFPLIDRVAAAFADDGAWSVDLLATRKGWHVTDLAVASESFHYPGCEHAASFQRERVVGGV